MCLEYQESACLVMSCQRTHLCSDLLQYSNPSVGRFLLCGHLANFQAVSLDEQDQAPNQMNREISVGSTGNITLTKLHFVNPC